MTTCVECGKPAGTGGSRYRFRPAKYCSAVCRQRAFSRRKDGHEPSPMAVEVKTLRAENERLQRELDHVYGLWQEASGEWQRLAALAAHIDGTECG